MTLSEIKAKEYIEGHNDGIKLGLEQGLERGRKSMLMEMLASFKNNRLPFDMASQLISGLPEGRSIPIDEVRKIWDELA